jgi:hypothetical protein
MAARRCWWCGQDGEVDTERGVGGGLIRDDGTMDGSESWICINNEACSDRANGRWVVKAQPGEEAG